MYASAVGLVGGKHQQHDATQPARRLIVNRIIDNSVGNLYPYPGREAWRGYTAVTSRHERALRREGRRVDDAAVAATAAKTRDALREAILRGEYLPGERLDRK